MACLKVWANGEYVGDLRQEDGLWSFQYSATWQGFALAPYWPVAPTRYQDAGADRRVEWFFDNLLPEGFMRELLARRESVSEYDTFALLARFGRDTAGALTLVAENEDLPQDGRLLPFSKNALQKTITRARERNQSLISAFPGLRMSLAGAQEKMGLHIDADGNTFLPLGQSPSTCIIKPRNDEMRFPHCPANEYFCMRLAYELCLNVPEVELWHLPEPVYVVRRFDRCETSPGQWQRLHQIDLCQMLGLPASKKYESEGGLGLQDLFAGLRQLQGDDYTPLPVLQWVVFNYLIGNNDAHAKNIGFFIENGKPMIAPFYDLLCVEVYLPGQGMAMALDGENRPGWIEKVHWQWLARVAGVEDAEVFQMLVLMAEGIGNWCFELSRDDELSQDEASFLQDRLMKVVWQRRGYIFEAVGEEEFLFGHAEVLRRVRVVEQARSAKLDLNGIDDMRSLPLELCGLSWLRQISFYGSDVSDLAPLAKLTALQLVDCSITKVTDLAPLANLTALQAVNCSDTNVADLAPLANLTALQSVDCSHTGVTDLEPLANLTALQSVDCSQTDVTDLAPLANLTTLQSVNCSVTGVTDLAPLANLTTLQSVNCWFTGVTNLAPLVNLTVLQSVNCGFTKVTNLAPLASLTALQSVYCNQTSVTDLAPLSNLTVLQSVACIQTGVTDLTPLANLPNLTRIEIDYCQIQNLPLALVWRKSLNELLAYRAVLPKIPPEVLSQYGGFNCLPRLRAHLRDLDAGSATIANAKLMLLGNGTVGKTQLCRRLHGQDFDPGIPSTHGVQVQTITHPQGEWHVWDFGGQDIYHSTHALFMKTRAVFVLVWSPVSEDAGVHEVGGITFRNHPLEYWVQYVRHTAGTDCPLLIVQTRCEQAQDEVRQLPLPDGLLDDFAWCKILHYSSKTNRGRAALDEALQDAHGWLLAQHPATIGLGRLRVQRALCAWRDADARLPSGRRKHRLVTQEAFAALCAEGAGDVSDPQALLDYMHHAGIVFYRENLFGNQIILDQGWALDAIYTVFERERCWKPLRAMGGKFTRSMLATLTWENHSEEEQQLFLSMMCSCGVAFVHVKSDEKRGIETEYIAPDLLPSKPSIQTQLDEKWDDTLPCAGAQVEYDVMRPGLLRGLVAKIGSMAGVNGLYWDGGVCVYEQGTRSRALIERVPASVYDANEHAPARAGTLAAPTYVPTWHGLMRIRTQGPHAAHLLALLRELLERETGNWKLHMKPDPHAATDAKAATWPGNMAGPDAVAESASTDNAATPKLSFGPEPTASTTYGVSYAWTDASKAEVDKLCDAAQARGIHIMRDTNSLGVGDRIAPFMARLAAQDRVFVILSDKYLKSPNCMYELFEIWRNAKLNDTAFMQCVRVYRLPDADIFGPLARAKVAMYWKEKFAELDTVVKTHGADILGAEDFKTYKRMQDFSHHIGDILHVMADTLQAKDFDELVKHGFA